MLKIMHKISISFFAILILFFACSERSGEQINNDTDTLSYKANNNKKPPSTFKDTLLVFENSVVFYLPDSLQKMALKKITDTALFKSQEHENFYQMRYSKIILNKYYKSIKSIEAKEYQYLKFVKSSGQFTLIDLNTKDDAYGLYIFDGEQEPQLVDMTNIETELGFYFKKK